MDNVSISPINGAQVTIRLNPSTTYQLEWWNTYIGVITNGQVMSNVLGDILLTIDGLADDKALKITGPGGTNPTNTPVPTSVLGDLTGDGHVTYADIVVLAANWSSIFSYATIVRFFGN
jgi:hypothetical protein